MTASRVLSLTVLTFVMSANMAFANWGGAGDGERSADAKVKEKVYKIVNCPKLMAIAGAEGEAIIEFIITEKKEVVVLKINTDNDYLEKAIEKKLNEETIDVKGAKTNKPYKLKITFNS